MSTKTNLTERIGIHVPQLTSKYTPGIISNSAYPVSIALDDFAQKSLSDVILKWMDMGVWECFFSQVAKCFVIAVTEEYEFIHTDSVYSHTLGNKMVETPLFHLKASKHFVEHVEIFTSKEYAIFLSQVKESPNTVRYVTSDGFISEVYQKMWNKLSLSQILTLSPYIAATYISAFDIVLKASQESCLGRADKMIACSRLFLHKDAIMNDSVKTAFAGFINDLIALNLLVEDMIHVQDKETI